jgi:hypothetical protein
LYELNPYLECVGLSEPLKKIYVTANRCDYIQYFCAYLILAQLQKLPSVKLQVPVFKGSSTELTQNNVNIPMINVTINNSVYLVIGTVTLLKQFNSEFRNQFIAILAQYVRSSIALNASQKSTDLPSEIAKILSFLEEFIDYSNLDRNVISFLTLTYS